MSENVNIDWSKFDPVVNWAARDCGGGWFGYDHKPEKGLYSWFCYEGDCYDYDGEIDSTVRWEHSLQQRPQPSPPVSIEPLTEQERTAVNAEIASLGGQLAAALTNVEHWRHERGKLNSQIAKVADLTVQVETLTSILDEYKFDNEGLRALLSKSKQEPAVSTFAWAIQEVINGNTVTNNIVCDHWRLGLFSPIDIAPDNLRLVWTNGKDWHNAVLTPKDFSARWSVYDPYEIQSSTKGATQ